MRSIPLPMLAYLLLTGCGGFSTGPEWTDLLVELEETLVVRDPDTGDAAVAFALRNTGESTIYLSRCGEHVSTLLDRWEGGQWVQFSSHPCPAIYDMSAFPLHAEAQRSGARGVHEGGRYRLRFGTSESPGGRVVWNAVSPAFRVE